MQYAVKSHHCYLWSIALIYQLNLHHTTVIYNDCGINVTEVIKFNQ